MAAMPVSIVGGGLSGLAAALAIVRTGGRAQVFERRSGAGARFHGDFQGLENWSSERDVLDELASFGIEPEFDYAPFRECVFFDPEGRAHECRSADPLWYLVRRGTEQGTLDQALQTRALAEGVEIQFGRTVEHLPDGGIVAHGPRRVDAIAVGYVFPTDMSDAAFGAVSDELAPRGYAYLLICRGRATLATCMFADFHNDKQYLERTVRFFEANAGITLREAKQFGGFGNMAAAPALRRGTLLLAGEAAGLQDALFGFGMRYALTSGHLAGRALANGNLDGYEAACRERFGPVSGPPRSIGTCINVRVRGDTGRWSSACAARGTPANGSGGTTATAGGCRSCIPLRKQNRPAPEQLPRTSAVTTATARIADACERRRRRAKSTRISTGATRGSCLWLAHLPRASHGGRELLGGWIQGPAAPRADQGSDARCFDSA